MKTQGFTVTDPATTARAASFLVASSAWFQVEPWPDDEYRITVKDEPVADRLREFLADQGA